ncbi:MAG: GNAT family N-acetyltransferase [Candidatus Hodarchaeota archaeon]
MNIDNLNIKIFKNFEDTDLKTSWIRIVKKDDYFLQNSFEWCSTWWKYYNKNKKLYIITVTYNHQILAIAPFYIEKKLIFSILKFIGSGFTDYHQILISKDCNVDLIVEKIFEYLNSFSQWDYIYLEQINNGDLIYNYLDNNLDFQKKLLVECPVGELKYKNFDDFLRDLKKSDRHKYRRIMKRLEEKGELKLIKIEDSKNFDKYFDTLIEIHNKRWANSPGTTKFMVKLNLLFLKDVFEILFELNKAVLYLLTLNNKIISYILGFIENQQFYSWNTSFDLDFHMYSPGTIVIALIIKDLIENEKSHDCYKYNHMRGGYDFKKKLVPSGYISKNFLFLSYKKNLKGLILNKYYSSFRDLIKGKFKKLLGNKSFRLIFRLDKK